VLKWQKTKSKHDFMAGKPGIRNAIGNKGGGRPSAYQERVRAELLTKMFFEPQAVAEIIGRVAKVQKEGKGKFSLWELFIAKAYSGNDVYIFRIFDRLFPEAMPEDANLPQLLSAAAKRLAAKYKPDAEQNDVPRVDPGPKPDTEA
jgi:hypothetical protein